MCHACTGAGTTVIRGHLLSNSSETREDRPKYEIKLRLTYFHYKGYDKIYLWYCGTHREAYLEFKENSILEVLTLVGP